MTRVRISCLQTRVMPDFEQSIAEAHRLAEQTSSDTRVLLLPEYCSGFKVENGRFDPPSAPESENPMLLAMQSLARHRGVWIVPGSVAVPNHTGERIFNRGCVIDDKGNIRSRYDKIHLFDIQLSATEVYRESEIVEPGTTLSLTPTPAGMLGYTICYDLRFPQLYRDLSQAGAELLIVPAAFTRATGRAHWHALCRARAIENGAWVVAPCAVGDIQGGGGSYGHSLIVNPWGEIIADGEDQHGIIEAEIDLLQVTEARARIPSLQHDRVYHRAGAEAVA